MPALDYSTIEAAALAQLQADATILAAADAGTPVHVTDSPDEPTAEQCPAVRLYLSRSVRTIRRLASSRTFSPYDEHLVLLVRCTAFAAESPADARRQRDVLTTLVMRALEADRTLGGACAAITIPSVDFEPLAPGYFASAVLTCDLLVAS